MAGRDARPTAGTADDRLESLSLEFLHCERALSLVIPTEPSASGRRGINAERFAWTVEKKESLRVDPSAAPQDDDMDPRSLFLRARVWLAQ